MSSHPRLHDEGDRPDRSGHDFHAAEARDAAEFRRRAPLRWWLTTLLPPGITALILIGIGVVHGGETLRQLITTALAATFFFGKFVILGGDNRVGAGFFSPAELALMVFYTDVLVAAVLVPHAGLLFRLPWIGARLRAVVQEGAAILRARPALRRTTFAGIAAFVMFPLAATGSVGGSIFGRLLGMSRLSTFVAIVVGSVAGCGLMYFGVSALNRLLDRDSPLVTIGGVAVVVALIVVLGRRYRRFTRELRERGEGVVDCSAGGPADRG